VGRQWLSSPTQKMSFSLVSPLTAGNKKIPSSIQAKSVCGLVVKSIVAMKEIHYLFNSLDGPRVRFPANAIKIIFFALRRE
jgi:hypothetical protein